MVELIGSFSQLKSAKVLVIGDFMLDAYTFGKVSRISPEAPVPVLHVQSLKDLPGGAGNVALNLKALGADVFTIGRIGNDQNGIKLKTLLQDEGINTDGIFTQNHYKTSVKNRLIANSQQLLRIDTEELIPFDQRLEEKVLNFIKKKLQEIEVIAVSDYAKGFLSFSLLQKVIQLGNQASIPILVDPKGDDFTKYQGATLIKPNLKEAIISAKLGQDASLDAIGSSLIDHTKSQFLVITRSEEGLTLFNQQKERFDFPVQSKDVKDVTGAGDTVLATIAIAFASHLTLHEGLRLANIAAGIAVEHIGCARISLSDLAHRLFETDLINKIFNENHLFALKQVLKGKNLTILGLNTKKGISNLLFTQIQKLSKKDDQQRLMIYLIDKEPDHHFISFLSSLHEVDFIVLQSDSLVHLSEHIHPAHTYILDNEKLFEITPSHLLSHSK